MTRVTWDESGKITEKELLEEDEVHLWFRQEIQHLQKHCWELHDENVRLAKALKDVIEALQIFYGPNVESMLLKDAKAVLNGHD